MELGLGQATTYACTQVGGGAATGNWLGRGVARLSGVRCGVWNVVVWSNAKREGSDSGQWAVLTSCRSGWDWNEGGWESVRRTHVLWQTYCVMSMPRGIGTTLQRSRSSEPCFQLAQYPTPNVKEALPRNPARMEGIKRLGLTSAPNPYSIS